MAIGSKSWRSGIESKTTNIASGFRVSGLWPLYLISMKCRLKLFKEGGIALSEENTTCMRCRETS